MKSKVKSCQFKKQNDSKFGTFYSFFIEFENGDSGFYNSKKSDGYPFNDTTKDVDYTIEKKEYTDKSTGEVREYSSIKYVSQNSWKGNPQKSSNSEVIGLALKYSGYETHKDFSKVVELYNQIMNTING